MITKPEKEVNGESAAREWEGIGDDVAFRSGTIEQSAAEDSFWRTKEGERAPIPKTRVEKSFGVQFGSVRLPKAMAESWNEDLKGGAPKPRAKWDIIGRKIDERRQRRDDEIVRRMLNDESDYMTTNLTLGAAKQLAEIAVSPDYQGSLEERVRLIENLPNDMQAEVLSTDAGVTLLRHYMNMSNLEDTKRAALLPKLLAGFCGRLDKAEPGTPEDLANRELVQELTKCGARSKQNRSIFFCEMLSTVGGCAEFDSEGTNGMDIFRGQLFDKFVEYGADPVDAALTMLGKEEIGKRFEVFSSVKELNLAQAICFGALLFTPNSTRFREEFSLRDGQEVAARIAGAGAVTQDGKILDNVQRERMETLTKIMPIEMCDAALAMQDAYADGSLAMEKFAKIDGDRIKRAKRLASNSKELMLSISPQITSREWWRFCLSDSAEDVIRGANGMELSDEERQSLEAVIKDSNSVSILSSVDGRSHSFSEIAHQGKELVAAAADNLLSKGLYAEARREMCEYAFGMPIGELGVDLTAMGVLEMTSVDVDKSRKWGYASDFYKNLRVKKMSLGSVNCEALADDGELSQLEKMAVLEAISLLCVPGDELGDKMNLYRENGEVSGQLASIVREVREKKCREASKNFSEYMQKSVQDGAKQIGETRYDDAEIPVLQMQGDEFALLVHKLGAYGGGKRRDVDPSQWDDVGGENRHLDADGKPIGYISTTMIGDGATVVANYDYVGEDIVYYGFAALEDDSIMAMSEDDLGTFVKEEDGKGRIEETRQDYLLKHPRQLLDRIRKRISAGVYRNTGVYPHSEVALRRFTNDGQDRLKPSHVVVFGKDPDAITETQKKHAAYFGVPILLIDREKYKGEKEDEYA